MFILKIIYFKRNCKGSYYSGGIYNYMGQVSSSGTERNAINFSTIQGEIQRHAATIRELASITYEDFINDVDELNRLTQNFVQSNIKQIIFKVKPGTDSTVLWKGTVRIDCIKIDRCGRIESSRQLNIRQFLQIRKIILCQLGAGTSGTQASSLEFSEGEPTSCNLTASMILNSVETMECQAGSLEECCICMERKPDIILPCAHNYCLPCIEQWNVTHKTCPICRETLESTDDSWVISEKPDSAEMTAEIQKCLIGFANKES